jgi:hypothetical protein
MDSAGLDDIAGHILAAGDCRPEAAGPEARLCLRPQPGVLFRVLTSHISGLFTGLRLAGHRSWFFGVAWLKSLCTDGNGTAPLRTNAGLCRDTTQSVGFPRTTG